MVFPTTIASPHQLAQEAIRIQTLFNQRETDGNWKTFDAALVQFKAWLKQGCASMENFIPVVRKNLIGAITLAILSERSKLSGTGCEVTEELAIQLKSDFDKLSDSLIPPILKLCARTNKVMVQRATKTLNQIVLSCAHLRFVHKFADAMGNQSKSLRVVVAGALRILLEKTHTHAITMELVEEMEKVIRIGLTDAEPIVREHSRASYHLYCEYFPDRMHDFDKTLNHTTKKYLSDRMLDTTKRSHISKSAHASPEKQQQPVFANDTVVGVSMGISSIKVSLERPQRAAALLSLGSKPQRILNSNSGPVSQGGSTRPKELTSTTLSKPQRVISTAADSHPKTAPGSTVTSPRGSHFIAGTAARAAPTTPAPKHLQGRPLRVAPDLKNTASIKLNGETVSVDISEMRTTTANPVKLESIIAAYSVEQEEVQKCGDTAAIVIIDKPEPSIFEEDELHEKTLDKLEASKSHEWSARVQAFQDISEILFDQSLDQDLRDKILSAFVQSLSDNHFRVIKIGLDVWNRLYEDDYLDITKYHETLLPLVLTISEDPQLRAKQEIRNSATFLTEKIQKFMSPVDFANVLFYTLNAPEFSKNCRVRHGAINLLHMVIPAIKQDFFNKVTVFRMAISRLLGCVSDSERLLTRKIREIIIAVHGVDEKMFFEAVAFFASTDRTSLRNLISKSIKDYVKHEDHAMNIKRSQRPGTEKSANISKILPAERKTTSIPVSKGSTIPRKNLTGAKSKAPSPVSSEPSSPVKVEADKPSAVSSSSTAVTALVDDCTQTPLCSVTMDPVEVSVSTALTDLDKNKAEAIVQNFVDSMIAELDEPSKEPEFESVVEQSILMDTAIVHANPEKLPDSTAQAHEVVETISSSKTSMAAIAAACLDDIIVAALNMEARSPSPIVQSTCLDKEARPGLFEIAENLGEAFLRGDSDAVVESLKENPDFWSGNQAFLLDYLLTAERLEMYKNVLKTFEAVFDASPRKEMVPLMLRYAVNESVTAKHFAEKLVTVGMRPVACIKQLLAIQESLDRSFPHFRVYFGLLTPVLCELLGDKAELTGFNYDLKLIDRLSTMLLESLLHTDVGVTIVARESMVLLYKAMADRTSFAEQLKSKVASLPPGSSEAVKAMLSHRFGVEQLPPIY